LTPIKARRGHMVRFEPIGSPGGGRSVPPLSRPDEVTMSPMFKALPLMAALTASAAYAQPAPSGPPAPAPAQPGAPQAAQNCPMMNGQRMMSGQAIGAHMLNGHMVDKDGKPIVGGMMGANGMPCVPQASANAQPGKAAPKANP
jgi:hypothetical protein